MQTRPTKTTPQRSESWLRFASKAANEPFQASLPSMWASIYYRGNGMNILLSNSRLE